MCYTLFQIVYQKICRKKIKSVCPLFSLKCFSMKNVKDFHMYALMHQSFQCSLLDLLFQKGRIIENAISYIFAMSVCLKTMYAVHFKISCFCITSSLFSPKPFFIFINHIFEVLSRFFSRLFCSLLIYTLPCHLSYHLCFACHFDTVADSDGQS